MIVAKLLKGVTITGTGCLGIILIIAAIWAVSALFWGTLLGLLLWNDILASAFNVHTSLRHLDFGQAMIVGAVASLFLG